MGSAAMMNTKPERLLIVIADLREIMKAPAGPL
jgi:hypothetical protein